MSRPLWHCWVWHSSPSRCSASCTLANVGEPDLLRDYPWLIVDITVGALAFMWGFVVLLTEYPGVQTVAVGILVVISCLVAPMGLMFALMAASRVAGGGD